MHCGSIYAISSALEPWLTLTVYAICAWAFWHWYNRR